MTNRFELTSDKLHGFGKASHIITDSETGVQYLTVAFSGGIGLTPLIDLAGKPIPAEKE